MSSSPMTVPSWKAWYVVAVLVVIYTCSFIDRTIISLMIQPIRRDLGISDTQISLLQGAAFAVFYTVMGLPLGWAVDKYSRRALIAAGTVLWSIMTALSGFARGFGLLFLARIGVGVGEATLSPAAMSLITDLFPRERLARALSVYYLGVSVGQGLAFLIGGTIIAMVSSNDVITLPALGDFKPWQVTFLAVGLPGILLGLLMFTIREPARRDQLTAEQKAKQVPIVDALRFMWSYRGTYGWWVAGNSILGIVMFGYSAWMPTTLVRTFGWTAGGVGQLYGVLLLVFGTSAAVVAGWLTDRLVQRGVRYPYYKMLFWICLAQLPFTVAAPLVNNETLAIVLLAGAIVFTNAWSGLSAAALQIVTPNEMRGQMVAVKFFFSSTTSFTVAPTLIAVLTDYVFGRDEAVRYSIATVSLICVPVALVCYRLARDHYERMAAERARSL